MTSPSIALHTCWLPAPLPFAASVGDPRVRWQQPREVSFSDDKFGFHVHDSLFPDCCCTIGGTISRWGRWPATLFAKLKALHSQGRPLRLNRPPEFRRMGSTRVAQLPVAARSADLVEARSSCLCRRESGWGMAPWASSFGHWKRSRVRQKPANAITHDLCGVRLAGAGGVAAVLTQTVHS